MHCAKGYAILISRLQSQNHSNSVILSVAKNPAFVVINTRKSGFFATLRMTMRFYPFLSVYICVYRRLNQLLFSQQKHKLIARFYLQPSKRQIGVSIQQGIAVMADFYYQNAVIVQVFSRFAQDGVGVV